jgi:hypothetical protein
MATLTAQSIIDKIEVTLQDTGNNTWTEAEHLQNLNDAIERICILRPDAYVVTAPVQLAAGAKQALPATGTALKDILRNMGADGSTPGNAVTLVGRADMNAALPGRMAATANATVVHWVYEPKDDAKTFYVYPPQPVTGMGYVEMRYAAVPAAIALGAVIPIDDNHENAITLFMLHRAWLKKQPALAGGFLSMFMTDLGLGEERKKEDDPNRASEKGGTR